MTRRWTILFVVSVFLNLFAIGAIGGGLLVMGARGGFGPHPAAFAHRPVVVAGAQLPAPERMRFNQTMRAVVRDNRALARIARENRRQAAALFVQPSFDQVAIGQALERARQADFDLRGQLEAAAIGFAAGLPLEERAVLAAGLARGGPLREPGRAKALDTGR
jgi:uncharacterized membrane protein